MFLTKEYQNFFSMIYFKMLIKQTICALEISYLATNQFNAENNNEACKSSLNKLIIEIKIRANKSSGFSSLQHRCNKSLLGH